MYVWGVLVDVWPEHTTNSDPILAARAAKEAPIYVGHPPLPASKAVLSSSRLLVIHMSSKCTRSQKSQLGRYDRVARVEALYMYKNIGDVQLTHLGIIWWLRVNTLNTYMNALRN